MGIARKFIRQKSPQEEKIIKLYFVLLKIFYIYLCITNKDLEIGIKEMKTKTKTITIQLTPDECEELKLILIEDIWGKEKKEKIKTALFQEIDTSIYNWRVERQLKQMLKNGFSKKNALERIKRNGLFQFTGIM